MRIWFGKLKLMSIYRLILLGRNTLISILWILIFFMRRKHLK